jgi:DNA-binding IclR family transcriptional regulator
VRRQTVIPEHVLQFVRRHIKSVWTLDLLVLMRREAAQAWTADTLARELRGNRPLVENALSTLTRAGLLRQEADGAYRYYPSGRDLDAVAAELERHYAERPVALIKEIASAPGDKIQSFADAFRIKKD